MEQSDVERLIGELEVAVDRLRALYEQYFVGIEKLEPSVPRKDVDRRIYVLRKEQIRNTALRFRFQMVLQRYNTYQTHWQRICREIENGTYKRHLIRAQRRFGSMRPPRRSSRPPSMPPASTPPPSPRPEPGAPLPKDLAAQLAELDRDFAPPSFDVDVDFDAPPVPAAAAAAPAPAGPPHAPSIAKRPGPPPMPPPRPPAATSPGPVGALGPAIASPTPGAPKTGVPVPPPRPPMAPVTAKPAVPVAASATPVAAKPAAPVPPVRPPAASAPAIGAPPPARPQASSSPDLSEARMKQLYAEYLDAKRKQNESTASLTYQIVAKSIRESGERLRQKHGKSVDFEVAIKDGRAILRPVIK